MHKSSDVSIIVEEGFEDIGSDLSLMNMSQRDQDDIDEIEENSARFLGEEHAPHLHRDLEEAISGLVSLNTARRIMKK